MEWKKAKILRPESDCPCLVCWLQEDGNYSSPHRAYYLEEEGHFFSLENNNSHPIIATIYLEIPDPNKKNDRHN